MKYPFRFTKSYIADINEIVNARLVNSEGSAIILTFKTGDSEAVECVSLYDCKKVFERFCDLCNRIAEGKIQGKIKMPDDINWIKGEIND